MSASADHERPPPPLLPCGIALSIALGIFAVVGWLLRGRVITADGFGEITAESAVPALYAALAVIMQLTVAAAAIAARRARSFNLEGSEVWARAVVVAGGLWNAYSLHNAFEMALPEDADWFAQFLAYLVSAAVAFVEIAIYAVDEAIKSEIGRRCAAADAAALAEARSRSAGTNIKRLEDLAALTDDALGVAIADTTGLKRRLEVERKRRAEKNIRINS